MVDLKARAKKFFRIKKPEFQSLIVVLTIFLLNLFFVLSELTPRLYDINPNDGAKYIESGRLLFEWGLRDLAWGPLVAFIYAPVHLIVGHSPNWFIIEAWAGNIILYGLIWFGFYYLASQFDKYILKTVIIAILFSTTVFFPIIENQSDALFVALSSFALANVIKFYKKGHLRNVWIASLFVGLGILTRVETIILFAPLLATSLILNKKKHKWVKVIVASILPALALISVFVIVNLITFGHANLGLGNKSYASFEMNQAFLPGSKNKTSFSSGEKIFGTAEENQRSIFRAIIRNPIAVAERALANLIKIPGSFTNFFGNRHTPLFLIFSLIGLYKLIGDKNKGLTSLILVWPLHAFVSLIFLPRHIIPQMSYLFVVLSGIGITYAFSKKVRNSEKLIFFLGSFVLMIIAIVTLNKTLFSIGILLSTTFFLNFLLESFPGDNKSHRKLPLLLLIMGMLLYGNGFNFPAKFIGRSEAEQGVQQLQVLIPSNSRVLVPNPIFAIAAKMAPIELPLSVSNVDEFMSFIRENEIDAIYVDQTWPQYTEFIMAVNNKNQSNFQLEYKSENDKITIFIVNF